MSMDSQGTPRFVPCLCASVRGMSSLRTGVGQQQVRSELDEGAFESGSSAAALHT
jgi:hypothetical protein